MSGPNGKHDALGEHGLLARADALLEAIAPDVEPFPDRCALDGGLFESLVEAGDDATLVARGARRPAAERGLLGIGDRLGSIRLEGELGQGGMGRVLRGFDEKLGRPVAVKSIHADHRLTSAARARFRREARLLSRLNHPSICQVYDLVERPEGDYLVFELVEGETLRSWIASEPPIADRLATVIAIVAAIETAHRAGVVHRDLKPENVMRTRDGAIKVLDFGIARDAADAVPPPVGARRPGDERTSSASAGELHTAGLIVGTPAYMSPEQRAGAPVGVASDVWALGVLAHELLTGRRPFGEPGPDADPPIELDPSLEPPLLVLLRRTLAVDPAARPSTTELASELGSIADAPARATRRRRWTLAAAIAVVAVTLAIVVTARALTPRPLFVEGETPRVAVVGLENATGDPQFDWVERGLAEMLADNLGRLDGVEVVPFADTLEYLGQRPALTRDQPESIAAELARAFAATVAVRARAEIGANRGCRLVYRADRPGILGSENVVDRTDCFAAANELTAQLGRRLAPQALAPDLRDRFSADPLVNRVYAAGLQDLRSERATLAEPFFRVALRLDPELTLAELRLAESLVGQAKAADAEEVGELVLDVARRREDQGLEAAALTVLANAAYARDDRPRAVEIANQAIALAHANGDGEREAAATHLLGRALRFLDPAQSRVAFERARRLFEDLGYPLGAAKALQALGVLDDEAGDPAAAEDRFREALAVAQDLDAPRLESICLDSLSLLAIARGDNAGALEILESARKAREQSGDLRGMIFTLNNFGDVYQALGRLSESEAAFREAERICGEIEAPNPCALEAFNFAELLLVTGRPAEALPLIERAEAYYGTEDPDIVFLRALHSAATGDMVAGRLLLDRAADAAGPERGDGYRTEFAEAISQRPARSSR